MEKEITIWFDMDGTMADLYGVTDWLPKLRAYDPSPYIEAKPLINMPWLARTLNLKKKQGYKLGIVSCLSKEPTPEYDAAVIKAKKGWLNRHLRSVSWDKQEFLPYSTPKSSVMKPGDILFDDEMRHIIDCEKNKIHAYLPCFMKGVLKNA